MNITERYQESHYCYIFVVFRAVVFGFTLGPWDTQSQALDHSCSVGYTFHLVEWALSQIRYWLVTPTKALWLGQCLCFSFDSMQSTFLYQIYQHVGMKALYRHQLKFYMFSELCRYCLQQWDIAVSLWRATYSLGNSLDCLRDSYGTPLANNSIRCNPIQVLGG